MLLVNFINIGRSCKYEYAGTGMGVGIYAGTGMGVSMYAGTCILDMGWLVITMFS